MEGKETIAEHGNIARPLTLQDVTLHRKISAGAVVEEDISCDSTFMRQTMPTIGATICEKMSWVPATMPIYLVMDNAGGHGTGETVGWYTRELLVNNNVIINHQCSCSPETNTLDLGFWMCLQAEVEKLHREQRTDNEALTKSVMDAWNNLPCEKLANVISRIPVVLQLIAEDNGGNDLVESQQGHLTRAPDEGE